MMSVQMRIYESICRFPHCKGETSGKVYFCEDHKAYRHLQAELFDRGPKEFGGAEPLTGIYLIGSPEVGVIRIGIASNIIEKLTSLQVGFPYQLHLYYASYTEREMAKRLEKECRDRFKEFGFHLTGEWFDANSDDATQHVQQCIEKLDIPVLSIDEFSYITAHWGDAEYDVEIRPVRERILADAVLRSG